jgi:flavin reductase (DIM6/NTAB) family NADH-FMN oxidoreductase RutF
MIFIPESLNEEERSSLLLSIVLPRPIALVTSLNGMDSSTNIAPFSLFNLVSLNPPIIFISIQKTKPSKRTSINIARAKEFVVNIPNYTIAEEMNKSAMPFNDKENDKFDFCKLTKVESQKIKTYGVKESLIRLECTLHSQIDLGGYEMFLGKIMSIYCDNSILEDKQVSIDKHEFISRLGPKELYAKIQSSIIFKMERCSDVYE